MINVNFQSEVNRLIQNSTLQSLGKFSKAEFISDQSLLISKLNTLLNSARNLTDLQWMNTFIFSRINRFDTLSFADDELLNHERKALLSICLRLKRMKIEWIPQVSLPLDSEKKESMSEISSVPSSRSLAVREADVELSRRNETKTESRKVTFLSGKEMVLSLEKQTKLMQASSYLKEAWEKGDAHLKMSQETFKTLLNGIDDQDSFKRYHLTKLAQCAEAARQLKMDSKPIEDNMAYLIFQFRYDFIRSEEDFQKALKWNDFAALHDLIHLKEYCKERLVEYINDALDQEKESVFSALKNRRFPISISLSNRRLEPFNQYFRTSNFVILETLEADHLKSLEGVSIPETVKKIDFSSIYFSSFNKMMSLTQLNFLREINLSHCHGLEDGDLKLLPPSISHLNLSDSPWLTGAGIEIIGQLNQLSILDLTDCPQLKDAGLRHLKEPLASLSLGGVKSPNRWLTDEGLKEIAMIATLTFLYLGKCPLLGENSLRHLSRSLRFLGVGNSHWLTGRSMVNIGQLPCLSKIDLSYCPNLKDQDLDLLPQTLETVQLLGNHGLTKKGIHHIAKLFHLSKVILEDCHVFGEYREILINLANVPFKPHLKPCQIETGYGIYGLIEDITRDNEEDEERKSRVEQIDNDQKS